MDHTGRFIGAVIGWSGKNTMHSFSNTLSILNLFKARDAVLFVPGNPNITVGSVQVPVLIIVEVEIWEIQGQM